jgi:lysophospholipase L1-like esterase
MNSKFNGSDSVWTMKFRRRTLAAAGLPAVFFFGACLAAGQSSQGTQEHWVAAWGTAQELAPTKPDIPVVAPDIKKPDFFKGGKPKWMNDPEPLVNQTVRMVVPLTLPAHRIRVELANAFGRGIVSLGEAHFALHTTDSSIQQGTDRTLTFSGVQHATLGPGQVIVSDPVDLDVPPTASLAVSLYVLNSNGSPSDHRIGLHTAYVSQGNVAGAQTMPDPTTSTSYLWLRSVDVAAGASDFAIDCLGDSITDGFATTVNADHAWSLLLARRLQASAQGPEMAVLNEGISGNEVLRDGAGVSALARLDRDVLSLPGVRWIVLLEGINDINIHGQVTGADALKPEDLIAGYRQIIERAHMQGIRVVGATLTPEEGVWLAGPVGEATRQAMNAWIRSSHAFDAVVDLDATLRDPAHPARVRAEYDSGDHIHPNDRGNEAMAQAFSPALFQSAGDLR